MNLIWAQTFQTQVTYVERPCRYAKTRFTCVRIVIAQDLHIHLSGLADIHQNTLFQRASLGNQYLFLKQIAMKSCHPEQGVVQQQSRSKSDKLVANLDLMDRKMIKPSKWRRISASHKVLGKIAL
jgi:hypothetical protein